MMFFHKKIPLDYSVVSSSITIPLKDNKVSCSVFASLRQKETTLCLAAKGLFRSKRVGSKKKVSC